MGVDQAGGGDTAPPVLAARAVEKRFFDNPVLRGVSIEVRAGRVHALLGENGAGKSTLINLLSGVLQPDAGTIEVDGAVQHGLTPAAAFSRTTSLPSRQTLKRASSRSKSPNTSSNA